MPRHALIVVPPLVLLLCQEDHVGGRFFKLSLAYFSGFVSQAHLGLTEGLTLNLTLRYQLIHQVMLLFSTHTGKVPVRPSHKKDQLHICLEKFTQPFQRGVQP